MSVHGSLEDAPHVLSFSEAIWSLTDRLGQLHTLAMTLADQYECATGNPRTGGASGPPNIIAETRPWLPTLPDTHPGLPPGSLASRAKFQNNLLVLAEKTPRTVPNGCINMWDEPKANRYVVVAKETHTPINLEYRANAQAAVPMKETIKQSPNGYLPAIADSTDRRPAEKEAASSASGPPKEEVPRSQPEQLSNTGAALPRAASPYKPEPTGTTYKPEPTVEPPDQPRASEKKFFTTLLSFDEANIFTKEETAGTGATNGETTVVSTSAKLAGPTPNGAGKEPRSKSLETGTSVFQHKSKIAILRKVWKEESQRIDMAEINDIFTVRVNKNVDKIVRQNTMPKIKGIEYRLRQQTTSIDPDQDQEQSDTNRTCILHPMSSLRLFWCFWIMVMISWDVLFIPMEAFPVPDLLFFTYIEWIIAIFWTLDIFVTFRTGYMNGTKLEMRSSRIAINYLKTWFIPDLMIVVFEWSGRLLTTIIQGSSLSRITRVLRAFRSIRLLRLTKLQAVLSTIEDQVNSPALQLLLALIKMGTLLCISMHLVTCLWFLIGDNTADGWVGYADIPACGQTTEKTGRGPIPDDDAEAIKEMIMWYFHSSRWVAAQANGRVDQDARRNMVEMGFTCIAAILGPMLCMSVFISKITATMMELNTMAQSRRAIRLQLNGYLSGHQVSATLTARLKAHLREHHDLQKEQDSEKFILSILPKQLQNDLLYEVRAPTVVAHRFFNSINIHFPQAIKHVTMQALRPVLTDQDETIFETGDACHRMIFAYRGRFIYSQNDMETHEQMVHQASAAETEEVSASQRLGDAFRGVRSSAAFVMPEEDFSAQQVSAGVWLSEAAIWLEWQNQGILTALDDGLIFGLEVENFSTVVNNYIDVVSLVVAYALQFEATMKNQTLLSDIIDMDFECIFTHHHGRESTLAKPNRKQKKHPK